MAVPVRVSFMGQIDLFKNDLYSIGPHLPKKSLKKQLNKKCNYEHTMNAIPKSKID